MRWLVAIGVALLAVPGSAVHADPGAPQLSPVHGRREDTKRLQEQLRDLERATSPAPAEPAAVEPQHRAFGTVGVVLLCVAGGAGAAAGALYLTAPSDEGPRTALLVTTAVTAAAGLTFVIADRAVRAAPTVAPHAVGLAISGRL